MDLAGPVTALDHARGATHPKITIVNYGDFECPVSRPAVQKALARADSNEGSVVSYYAPLMPRRRAALGETAAGVPGPFAVACGAVAKRRPTPEPSMSPV